MATLVAIPGIMSDGRTWAHLIDALDGKVSAVHIADTKQDDTLEAMAARALAATEGELLVVAHSMGGRVAMEMGRLAPHRIRGMVLSSTGHRGPSDHESAHREARIAEANADMTAYAKSWVPKVISSASAADPALVAQIQAMVEDCPAEAHERQNRALLARPDASNYLGNLAFPVLLITGAQDTLSTEATHAEIAALLPDAESLVIPGAGHLLPFEKPELVTKTVIAWFNRKMD